ncbi:Uncharacterised protein [Mycobacteroides abscessus]|nr:Uncharacterised protein [Mycobacteroides abscessus]
MAARIRSSRVTAESGIATRRSPAPTTSICSTAVALSVVSCAYARAMSAASDVSTLRAIAWRSRMSATPPSPSTVAPEYMPICLRRFASALTTISSMLRTRSTITPKRWSSASTTAMTRPSDSGSSPSTSESDSSGSSVPRSRKTGAVPTCSISPCWSPRATSSRRLTCGIA